MYVRYVPFDMLTVLDRICNKELSRYCEWPKPFWSENYCKAVLVQVWMLRAILKVSDATTVNLKKCQMITFSVNGYLMGVKGEMSLFMWYFQGGMSWHNYPLCLILPPTLVPTSVFLFGTGLSPHLVFSLHIVIFLFPLLLPMLSHSVIGTSCKASFTEEP